jgi:hypothetical protein
VSTAYKQSSVLSLVFRARCSPFAHFFTMHVDSLSLSALNTFLERAESELTMSCRESDSHMTEASRCGPHTASSECRCAYAPPSPFPNSPASRGQMIPADRWRTLDAFSVQRHACSPTTARPLACMPVQWHACVRARQQPVRPHHVWPHVVPTAPPHSPLHSPSLSITRHGSREKC